MGHMRGAIPFTVLAGGFFNGRKKNIQFDKTIARHEDDTVGVDVEVAEMTNGYQHGTNSLHRPRLALQVHSWLLSFIAASDGALTTINEMSRISFGSRSFIEERP
jgi:hypothetical protein